MRIAFSHSWPRRGLTCLWWVPITPCLLIITTVLSDKMVIYWLLSVVCVKSHWLPSISYDMSAIFYYNAQNKCYDAVLIKLAIIFYSVFCIFYDTGLIHKIEVISHHKSHYFQVSFQWFVERILEIHVVLYWQLDMTL